MFQQAGIADTLYPEIAADNRLEINPDQAAMDVIALDCFMAMENAIPFKLPNGVEVWATPTIEYETERGKSVALWLYAEKMKGDRWHRQRGQNGDRTISLAVNGYWNQPLAYVVPENDLHPATVLIAGEELPAPDQFTVLMNMTGAIRERKPFLQKRPEAVPVTPRIQRVRELVIDRSTIDTFEENMRLGRLVGKIQTTLDAWEVLAYDGKPKHSSISVIKRDFDLIQKYCSMGGAFGVEDFAYISEVLTNRDYRYDKNAALW